MYIREVRQSAENGVAEFRHFSKTGQKAVFSKRHKKSAFRFEKAARRYQNQNYLL